RPGQGVASGPWSVTASALIGAVLTMGRFIVPDRLGPVLPPRRLWMTTRYVAKRFGVSTRWVRWLARMGELPHEITEAGQRIFRRSEIERAVLTRRDVLARSRPTVLRLRAVRLRMLKVQPPKVQAPR